MKYSLDYWAVIITFSNSKVVATEPSRFNFYRIKWDRVCKNLSAYSNYTLTIDIAKELKCQTKEITCLVQGIVARHIPEAKSLPYMKA